MNTYKVKEPVRVAVIFTPGQPIKPMWFEWRRHKHTVLETIATWESRRGESRLIHFAVRDDGTLYELIYNTKDQTWILEGIGE